MRLNLMSTAKVFGSARRKAFTLVEVMIATAVLGVLIAAVLTALLHMLRAEAISILQTSLDTDVQKIADEIKRTMRLSSVDYMTFFPAGAEEFTAVSYPVPADTNGDSVVDMEVNGDIVWGRTMIYHVYPTNNPSELRLTRFLPRDNTLTTIERQKQLVKVVSDGSGANAINGANSQTFTVSYNLVDWRLHPRGSPFEGYGQVDQRIDNVVMGGGLLRRGLNTLRFEMTEKHPDSSGYHLRLDTLNISATRVPMEATAMLPVGGQHGAFAQELPMPSMDWNDGKVLDFPATTEGSWLELDVYNDHWMESTFSHYGVVRDGTRLFFDSLLQDRIVRLEGGDVVWDASGQSLGEGYGLKKYTDIAALGGASLEGAAVRVLIRGNLAAGGIISDDGEGCRVFFKASNFGSMQIIKAFIGESVNGMNPNPDIVNNQQLFFGKLPGVSLTSKAPEAWTNPVDMPIDPDKTYAVSFLFSNVKGAAMPWVWPNTSKRPDAFVIPYDPVVPPVMAPEVLKWTAAYGAKILPIDAIPGVSFVQTVVDSKGTYTSRIIDTRMLNPVYNYVNWDWQWQPGYVEKNIAVMLKLRSASKPDMSDATDWASISNESPGMMPFGNANKRYVQFQATLVRSIDKMHTPYLQSTMVRWPGAPRMVGFVGTFGRMPTGGRVYLTVNGADLTSALRMDIELYGNIAGYGGKQKRLVSTLSTEFTPRNSIK